MYEGLANILQLKGMGMAEDSAGFQRAFRLKDMIPIMAAQAMPQPKLNMTARPMPQPKLNMTARPMPQPNLNMTARPMPNMAAAPMPPQMSRPVYRDEGGKLVDGGKVGGDDYVIDAYTVAAICNGSSDAGGKLLDQSLPQVKNTDGSTVGMVQQKIGDGMSDNTESTTEPDSDGDGNPRLLITSGGDITNNVGNVSSFSRQNAGFTARNGDSVSISRNNGTPLEINRIGNDGTLVDFRQADSSEGSISVSGSTVSYSGFAGRHESSGISTDTEKGTVVSTIDELDVYVEATKEGQTRADHAKVKISDSVGDKRVYGVVDNFESSGKVNVSSVGIAAVKVTGACAGGDLLESNGDGTAKVQSDDVIKSKTIGKVTIGNSDAGVKLVSCVLYCG